MNINIAAKRSRIPFAIFIYIPVTLIFLYLLKTDDGSLPFFYYRAFYLVIAIYGILMTIIAIMDYLKTVFDKNASLVLTGSALNDNLSILSCGEVPWEEVSDVEIKKTRFWNISYLVVNITDQDKYLKNRNPFFRYILNRYIRTYGSLIVISEQRIDYDLQQLKQDMNDRRFGISQ